MIARIILRLRNVHLFEKKFISKDGRGEVYVLYAIFENATQARIEVKFFTDDGYNPEVYGVVAASTSEIETLEFSSMLFIKKPSDKIKVVHRKPFPLSRSIVVVPLGSELFLDMHLVSRDKVFLEHAFKLQAKKVGIDKETFKGTRYNINVEVSWDCE